MADNLAAFNKKLQLFTAKTIPELTVKVQKKIAFDALGKLVRRTPVDTGRARGGWQVEILGQAGAVAALENIAGRHERLDKSGAATIREGAAALANLPPFCIVAIVNNVHYIIRLENGHSKQAPNGMLALTFSDLVSMFR